MTKKDRVLGSLVGFAIGDAMGATTEFMTAKEIRRKYRKLQGIVGGGWLNLPAGAVTDDTQMMLCVYRAIKDTSNHPERTLDAVCGQFRAWADTNPPDIGGACYRAIYGCPTLKADDWVRANLDRQNEAGIRDLGNGGLMRCLVPCLLGNEELAVRQACLTHTDPLHAVYVAMYYQLLQDSIVGVREKDTMPHTEPTGHVRNTLYNCEYWYKESDTFMKAIIGAVNDGGDADTIAALTGGLAGAYYGFQAIPEHWVKALDPVVLRELMECAEFILDHSN